MCFDFGVVSWVALSFFSVYLESSPVSFLEKGGFVLNFFMVLSLWNQ